MESHLTRIVLGFVFILLTACGGSTSSPSNNAVAVAGSEQDIARNGTVSLDGSGSSDPENENLSYTWTQTYGPDVTAGAGVLIGVSPTFTAPSSVSTLVFDLTVSNGQPGSTAADSIQINVLEHTGPSYYVDGDSGSDLSGDGGRANPFASISYAISQITGSDYDIYVKTLVDGAQYNETANTLDLLTGTSLYGGYGANWIRDIVNNRTGVDGHSVAVRFASVNTESWFSGFNLSAADSVHPSAHVSGVSAFSGLGTIYIEDNNIVTGNVGAGASDYPASSYGVQLGGDLNAVRLHRNNITAGDGGHGRDNPGRSSQSVIRRTGDNAVNRAGANGGDGAGTNDGGAGGTGGLATYADGTSGGGGGGVAGGVGGPAGKSSGSGTGVGGNGGAGLGGNGGIGGDGAKGVGFIEFISSGGMLGNVFYGILSGGVGLRGLDGCGVGCCGVGVGGASYGVG